MIYLVCRNLVRDFPKWQQIFAAHEGAHLAAGLRLIQLGHEIEDAPSRSWVGKLIEHVRDPSVIRVHFIFEVENIDKARAFIAAPGAADAARDSGVIDAEYYFVDAKPSYR